MLGLGEKRDTDASRAEQGHAMDMQWTCNGHATGSPGPACSQQWARKHTWQLMGALGPWLLLVCSSTAVRCSAAERFSLLAVDETDETDEALASTAQRIAQSAVGSLSSRT